MGILLGEKANASRKSGKDGMAKLDQSKPKTDKIAKDLRASTRKKSGNNDVSVILQFNDEISNQLKSLLKSNGIKVKKSFISFNSLSADLPASVVETLASFPEVEYISVDSDVRVLGGHVSHTTGADNVRTMGPNGQALDGTGIGIAVLDSGIYPLHDSFDEGPSHTSRITVNKDFTGEGITDDVYGHGSHVASAVAGNGTVSKGKYIGIAPNANIVSLRVLDSQGVGKVSSVLAALDWALGEG